MAFPSLQVLSPECHRRPKQLSDYLGPERGVQQPLHALSVTQVARRRLRQSVPEPCAPGVSLPGACTTVAPTPGGCHTGSVRPRSP